jgi:hypothetical protein
MKTIMLYTFLFIFALHGLSQNEFAENWHFGDSVNLDFTSGMPVATSNSSIFSYEGCVSVSDRQGNLLFYSNGGNMSVSDANIGGVWNRNHQVMPNGQLVDTAGCYSSIQSSVVTPKVGSQDQYYLFTMDCIESQQTSLTHYKGLRYTVVDMALDGGLGDVTSEKGIPLLNDPGLFLSEGIAATAHSNGDDYWLIVHSVAPDSMNRFYVYSISSTGISGPSIQDLGHYSYGQMKFNIDGNRFSNGSHVFDFDKSNGTLSNPIDLGVSGSGKAFSNSGQYLYQTAAFTLYQYDLFATDVVASRTTIHTGNIFDFDMIKVSMQRGPDCKIYVAIMTMNYVGVINSPDLPGTACNYVNDQVTLPGYLCQAGLPNFIESDFRSCESLGIFQRAMFRLNLYPNPTSNSITIDIFPSLLEAEFSIVDIFGKTIFKSHFNNLSQNVNTSEFDNGVYFLRVSGTDAVMRFVKGNK